MAYTLSARRRLNEKSQNVVAWFNNSEYNLSQSVSIMKQWCEKITLFDGIYKGTELSYISANIFEESVGTNDGFVADINLVVCTNKSAGLPNIIIMNLKQVGSADVTYRVYAEFAKLANADVYLTWQIMNVAFIIKEMDGEM